VNTCAGCLPKVTGVQRLLPVLAARQKLPPETAAERKLLTHIPRTHDLRQADRTCLETPASTDTLTLLRYRNSLTYLLTYCTWTTAYYSLKWFIV